MEDRKMDSQGGIVIQTARCARGRRGSQLVFGGLATLVLLVSPLSFAFSVQMASSPESNLALTLSAIQSAQRSLRVNIYDLSSPEIIQALTDQVSRGVQVEILEEGQPVGGIKDATRALQAPLIQAMMGSQAGDRFVEMSSKSASGNKVKRRFRYDHAKYIVIDGSSILVGSENYSPSGQPSSGAKGDRGWEVLVQDPDLGSQFSEMFESDSNTQNDDIQDLLSDAAQSVQSGEDLIQPWASSGEIFSRAAFSSADASSIEPIASPTSSEAGLVNLIHSAQSSIHVELMTFAPTWKVNKSTLSSPLLDALIEAARRGVQIAVLLNDPSSFGGKPDPKNGEVVSLLNQSASSEGLPIQARIAHLKAMGVTYIHNKGVLVDGQKTLVSSINWDQTSIESNREIALILTSPEIYNFYESTFESDWNNSAP